VAPADRRLPGTWARRGPVAPPPRRSPRGSSAASWRPGPRRRPGGCPTVLPLTAPAWEGSVCHRCRSFCVTVKLYLRPLVRTQPRAAERNRAVKGEWPKGVFLSFWVTQQPHTSDIGSLSGRIFLVLFVLTLEGSRRRDDAESKNKIAHETTDALTLSSHARTPSGCKSGDIKRTIIKQRGRGRASDPAADIPVIANI
jgi:hypothetical protein